MFKFSDFLAEQASGEKWTAEKVMKQIDKPGIKIPGGYMKIKSGRKPGVVVVTTRPGLVPGQDGARDVTFSGTPEKMAEWINKELKIG